MNEVNPSRGELTIKLTNLLRLKLALVFLFAFLGAHALVAQDLELTRPLAHEIVRNAPHVSAVGVVQPSSGVNVGSRISGQISAVYVDVGDEVEEGQLLAEIDPSEYNARLQSTRASLDVLRVRHEFFTYQVAHREQELDRASTLLERNASTATVVEEMELELRSSRSELAVIEAEIRRQEAVLVLDRLNLERTSIYAPISGTITSLNVSEGQTVNATQTTPIIAGIASLTDMTVEAYISEVDIGRVSIGDTTSFTILGDNERRWSGAIHQIYPLPEVINNLIFYKAVIEIENTDKVLRIGMTAQVRINPSASSVVVSQRPPEDEAATQELVRYLEQIGGRVD